MIFVILGAAVALLCYLMGFFTGKRYADQKIDEMRIQMGLDIHEDAWDELFRGDDNETDR